MNITRFFHYKCNRNQIWPWRKKRSRSTQIHHLCNPGRAHIPNATYQVPRPLEFWFKRRKYYLRVFNLYGHGGHLGHVTFVINLLPPQL